MKKIPKLVSSNTIYKDTHIHVKQDVLNIEGFSWNQVYLVWNNKDSVCVIPYEKEGIYLIRQYRHASGKFFWQIPGGIMEKHVTAKKLAVKELKEETGFYAKKIVKIGIFSPEAGLTSAKVQVFLATQLTKASRQLEKSEQGMKLKFFPLKIIDQMIQKGKLHCGITLSSYLLFKYHLNLFNLVAT